MRKWSAKRKFRVAKLDGNHHQPWSQFISPTRRFLDHTIVPLLARLHSSFIDTSKTTANEKKKNKENKKYSQYTPVRTHKNHAHASSSWLLTGADACPSFFFLQHLRLRDWSRPRVRVRLLDRDELRRSHKGKAIDTDLSTTVWSTRVQKEFTNENVFLRLYYLRQINSPNRNLIINFKN